VFVTLFYAFMQLCDAIHAIMRCGVQQHWNYLKIIDHIPNYYA